MDKLTITGKIAAINIDLLTGAPQITFTVNEKTETLRRYDAKKGVEMLTITVEPNREKRTPFANAYAWKLINEIANVLRASKKSIYLEMLRRYGQSEIVSIDSEIQIGDFVKYYDFDGESTMNGKQYKHYIVYKGSSEFNTREMAIFIDGIVDEAQALNIPTEIPEEIKRIKRLWKE